jgi:heat shock protein HtpX
MRLRQTAGCRMGIYFMNTFKSTLLLVALMLVLVALGDRFGGRNGMILAFVISVVMNFTAYFYSDKIALRMYRAQPVTREELPRAYEVVERLTAKQGLPMPKIYVLPTESPNAFATGRNPQHASVAVTHGILGLLDDEELEGVLAHELGHVKNRDILTSSIAATLAGAITLIARMGYWASLFGGFGGGDRRGRDGGGFGALLMLIVAPIAATLIQLAVSRSREYEADATGAHTTGNPYALARALQKLENYSKRVPLQATPSTAHLFIIAPLIGGGIGSLFSTHPPTKERIRRLIGRDLV